MPRLVFLDRAKRDLAEIAARIERDSMSRATADAFIDKLIAYCQRLAALPNLMGGARPELRTTYRSATFGNYVIFLTYESEGSGPRDVLKIAHVLWGARGDKFAAVAPVAGVALSGFRDFKPLPALHITGEKDLIVPYKAQLLTMEGATISIIILRIY